MRKLDTIQCGDTENESIYYRIVTFASNVQKEKAQKLVDNGKYETLDKALENTPVPNVMSVVKNIAMKKPVTSSSFEEKIAAINHVVTKIMDITPVQFYAIWSTDFNKKYALYSTINAIAKEAPLEIKKECFFDTKMTFFRTVWPDVYEKYIKSNTKCVDIYYASGELKAGLIRAGSTDGIAKKKKTATYGNDVDEILMDAICDMLFDVCGFEDVDDMFRFLGNNSKEYYEKKSNDKDYAGICEIVESRGYTSLLDFYFLKCPEHFQKKYAADFLLHRRLSHIPREPLIEIAVEEFLEMENERYEK